MNDVEDRFVVRDLKQMHTFANYSNQEDAMRWVDNLLEAIEGYSFLSELNEIQAECNPHSWGTPENDKVFPDKFKMPLKIINLVLKEHGLKIEHI